MVLNGQAEKGFKSNKQGSKFEVNGHTILESNFDIYIFASLLIRPF